MCLLSWIIKADSVLGEAEGDTGRSELDGSGSNN
jgi:hypothetical protein